MSQASLHPHDRITIHTPRPTPWGELLDPRKPVAAIIAHRDLIMRFTSRQLQGQYRGTQLGVVWNALSPLLLLAAYTLVFSTILNVRLSGRENEGPLDYAILLFVGLMVFQAFSQPISQAPTLVTSKPNLVKKVVFPLEILPVTTMLAALASSGVGLGIVMIVHLVRGGSIGWWALAFPLVLVPIILITVGVGWMLGSLGVFIRDLQPLVGTIVQRLLFFLTPIFYSLENIPESFRPLMHLNPLTGVVDGARNTLIFDRPPDWVPLGIWFVASLVIWQVGYVVFAKGRRGFADVL